MPVIKLQKNAVYGVPRKVVAIEEARQIREWRKLLVELNSAKRSTFVELLNTYVEHYLIRLEKRATIQQEKNEE